MDRRTIDYLQDRARSPFTIREPELEADERLRQGNDSDQALRVLSGLGGFLSSLLFLLFLWLTNLLEEPIVSVGLGIVLIIVTILLGRTHREAFLATTTVCGYLVGVGLIMVGLPPSIETAFLVIPVLVIALATVVFTRNYYLILLAALSLPGCLVFLHLVEQSPWWTWLALFGCAAILTGLTFYEYRLVSDRRLSPFRSGIAVGFMLTLVWCRWVGVLFPNAGGIPTVLPLFLGCLLLLILSFRNQHLLGIGLAIAGLAYFTVQYYYDLRWDLLGKSINLMLVGSLLLVAYFVLHRINARSRE
ncbi:DUF4401 domain-containing protein [Lewinella sp. IMCC34191]|uniref:DUF4401 domain-containing protein n=1 Tax=Lewinella sp. IMCC34191 TaxID=2259172 RepID=UPI000E27E63F|nr:DUF4401 domain-containing protein [Lewinella sp. IMCC34191]